MNDEGLPGVLERWRQIEQAASPGPWRLEWDSCDCGDGYGCSHGSWVHAIRTSRAHVERPGGRAKDYDYSHSEVYELGDDDARFITEARTVMPRLLAVVDELLKLADKWDRDAYRLAAYAAAGCANQVREVITRELTGKESADGGR